jgi:hypothetical protein
LEAADATVPEFDHTWKLILDELLKETIAFFQSDVYALINRGKPIISWDKELQKLAYDSVGSDKSADKLLQVSLLSGQAALLLIHVEVQQLPQSGFTRRM